VKGGITSGLYYKQCFTVMPTICSVGLNPIQMVQHMYNGKNSKTGGSTCRLECERRLAVISVLITHRRLLPAAAARSQGIGSLSALRTLHMPWLYVLARMLA